MMNLEMNSLRHQDTLHVEAAQGWLELGSCAEAARELDQVSPAGQPHPQVLEVRWTIHFRRRRLFAYVERELSICLADLGFGRVGLFHLWQEAGFLGAHDRRSPHDRRLVFC
jgi:hypothetical protein